MIFTIKKKPRYTFRKQWLPGMGPLDLLWNGTPFTAQLEYPEIVYTSLPDGSYVSWGKPSKVLCDQFGPIPTWTPPPRKRYTIHIKPQRNVIRKRVKITIKKKPKITIRRVK